MALQHCTPEDRRIIGECLRAAVDGPFFPDWEFSTLFGVNREEVASVMKRWPTVDDSDEVVFLAVSNAIANLVGYPHGREDQWARFLSVSPNELLEVLKRWRVPRQG